MQSTKRWMLNKTIIWTAVDICDQLDRVLLNGDHCNIAIGHVLASVTSAPKTQNSASNRFGWLYNSVWHVAGLVIVSFHHSWLYVEHCGRVSAPTQSTSVRDCEKYSVSELEKINMLSKYVWFMVFILCFKRLVSSCSFCFNYNDFLDKLRCHI